MKKSGEGLKGQEYLECERLWIFLLLTMAGGYFGGYTYVMRGGVFCNAQTANFIFMGMRLGTGDFSGAAYYLIPMAAYFAGVVFSEILPSKVKWKFHIRWDTILVGFEILVAFGLGFLSNKCPFQVSQIALTFIAAMQYNTFRQAQHIPMATVFCTNNLRQSAIHTVKWLRTHDKDALIKVISYLGVLASFLVGVVLSTIVCHLLNDSHAVWGAILFLAIVFIALLHADLTKEKAQMDHVPSGH